ncbi:Nose resistant to fluoxetine protein 6 [Halotydeus destructor]|nr:Nose resistant to fluoxetine protein 6 [Halotydeus destructor]
MKLTKVPLFLLCINSLSTLCALSDSSASSISGSGNAGERNGSADYHETVRAIIEPSVVTALPEVVTLFENRSTSNKERSEIEDEQSDSDDYLSAAINGGLKVLKELGHKAVSSTSTDSDSNGQDDEDDTEVTYDDYVEDEVSERSLNGIKSDNATKVFQLYKRMYRLYTDTMGEVTREFTPLAVRASSHIPTHMWPSLLTFVNSLLALHPWALRFIDACGKIPYGLVDGTVSEFGEYDQCLDIEVPDVQDAIYGKYCVMDIKLPLPVKPETVRLDIPVFQWNGTELQGSIFDHLGKYFHTLFIDSPRLGICIPSHFAASDVTDIVNSLLDTLKIRVEIPDSQCITKRDPVVMTTLQKTALGILATTASLTALATILDYLCKYHIESLASFTAFRILLSFSILSNTRRLLTVNRKTIDLNGSRIVRLDCIHGLRVVTMFWIVINHTYLLGGFYLLWIYRRITNVLQWTTSYPFQFVYNGWLAVETYFLFSGLLFVFCTLPGLIRSGGNFNYVLYLGHRVFRILPALVGAICLNVVLPLVISGPVALVKAKAFIATPCENYWWSSLLFINNWFEPKDVATNYWEVPIDLTDDYLYLLIGLCYLLLGPSAVSSHRSNRVQHLPPYVIGMFLGYLLVKRPEMYISWFGQLLAWLILPALALYTLVITAHWNASITNQPSLISSSTYVALRSSIWSLAIAWLIFTLSTGRAKFLNDLLSWTGFVPLSRLNYTVFLTHTIILNYRFFSLKQTQIWSDFNFIYYGISNFFISIFVAYLLYISFESPFVALEKLLFNSKENVEAPSGERSLGAKIDFPVMAKFRDATGFSGNGQQANFNPVSQREYLDKNNTASRRPWDNSVQSKSFIYVDRM